MFKLPMINYSVCFEFLEELGGGSQGRVYKCLERDPHSEISRTVAVKVLHSRNAVETWRQEFESLSRVDSPHCVRVLSFTRVQRKPALVLEYVDGMSLAEIIPQLPEDSDFSQEILAQLEKAVQALAALNLFHGDLSPRNVLIDRQGKVKVLDFGLANACDQNPRLTPEFASPERLLGDKPNLASDLFSLGRIELLFPGHDLRQLLNSPYLQIEPRNRHFRELIPNPDRQQKLAKFVSECLNKKLQYQAKTQTRENVSSPSRTLKPSATAAIFLIALVLASSSASPYRLSTPTAELRIRTEKWLRVRVNGKPVGFTPISLSLAAGREHRVEWESATSRGQKRVQLNPDSTLTWNDRDFSH